MKKKKLIIGLFCAAGIVFGTVAAVCVSADAKAAVRVEQKDSKKFVKTNYRCNKCSCSGYHGYLHQNGTYEGSCQNTDQWGHRCGHSPEHHGLRSW